MAIKKFLTKVALFVLVFLGINAVIVGVIFTVSNNVSFKLPKEKHVLVIGDSHTTLAVNDKYLPQGINMSSEGEGYIYTYLKLKKMLAANKHIDTVILSFNFNSIYKARDEWTIGDSYITGHIPHYLPFFGADEYDVFKCRTAFYGAIFKTPYENKKALFNLLANRFKVRDLHLGGYVPVKGSKLGKDIEIRSKAAKMKADFEGYSTYQLTYLNKIIAACKDAGKTVILLNTPINKRGFMLFNTKKYYEYYNTHLKNIPLWDYNDLPYSDDEFRDVDHLNSAGAKKFTILLDQKLRDPQK